MFIPFHILRLCRYINIWQIKKYSTNCKTTVTQKDSKTNYKDSKKKWRLTLFFRQTILNSKALTVKPKGILNESIKSVLNYSCVHLIWICNFLNPLRPHVRDVLLFCWLYLFRMLSTETVNVNEKAFLCKGKFERGTGYHSMGHVMRRIESCGEEGV